MRDAHQSSFLPLSQGTFTPATPSGLTPNTRSEAEAALTHNSSAQTDSAAPIPAHPPDENASVEVGPSGSNTQASDLDDGIEDAKKAYRRPPGPIRTSSKNYENALREAHKNASASSNLPMDTVAENITGVRTSSPASTIMPFPPPGQGVVPLLSGVGSGQANAVKRVVPTGLSLGNLGRSQSWNEQDMKHVFSANLMVEVQGDPGYASGAEESGVGPV
ncbi:uncharacterized protein BDR25DRAFT_336100 [Lindgomyces ingoldianus]|uniref:Uncharacterized protein n=1 Tax=Lindgomyces ingoldianus TaxID=673940 RepID=A0ACB6QLE8_9PLEO|nr:uncharacterized protein BDR25DRAFT_336100 [Lindgomyces ingoldianus]KAF2467350.1 hypothetical protein BDR25DRAFT_336100 [Lindgomyces ingoldianus]